MKNISFCIMVALIMLSFIPTPLRAATEKSATTIVSTRTSETTDNNEATVAGISDAARSEAQLARLEEIRAMDMSSLTPSEKKELREEVHAIQNEQDDHYRDRDRHDNDGPRHHRHGGVVFIGGGGLLLIILILLLL